METRKVFPQFQQLHIEIRLMIWRECLPSRVIEIDFPADRNRPYKCTLVWPNRQTRLPPALTKVVTIHATRAAAAESGLFGLLLDAPIQLVDATDTSKIAKFHELWASNSALDTTPSSFFRDQVSFQVRVRQWLKELVALWVYYPWMKAWKDKWQGVIDPEGIWLGPRIDEDAFLRDMLIPGCLESDPGPPFCVDYNLFSPNMDHPFAQEALIVMPQFRPRVMFRYCPLDCHLQKQGGMGSR
ncbi:predicted protein [Aspergillus terreus NIH2624]|uniref:2EXR domain-containing protein n=1 Tax=Aspergillus terreus (strain NIH 2624 / FGSC A1156) TaxID=341663 RepID=Q0CBL7_ASPTN|nr:uncharacterized protein ATEG_08917 [Aspergillus terreus NIH2624]EAU31049.1 predicted protein [Aspergillus terreus NIH2624]